MFEEVIDAENLKKGEYLVRSSFDDDLNDIKQIRKRKLSSRKCKNLQIIKNQLQYKKNCVTICIT